MNENITSAFIAGIVALVVAVLSAILTSITNKKVLEHAKHESKRTGITVQRMNWIAEIRNLFAQLIIFDFMALITKQDKYDEFNKTTQLLKLYLNFNGKIDQEILDSLDALVEAVDAAISGNADVIDSKGTFEREKSNIQIHAHIYLKSEWNRVKFESDPKNIDKKYNEEEAITELKEKYKDAEIFINSRPQREAAAVYKMLNNKDIKS